MLLNLDRKILKSVSNNFLQLLAQIENQIRTLFTERKIDHQFVFEDMEYAKVFWEKKRVSAELVDNTVVRKEHFVID